MALDLSGIIDWLKGWFYDKNEVNAYLNAKANKNLTNANMNVVTDASGNITTEAKPVMPDISGKIDTAGTGLSKSGTTLNHSNSITAQTSAIFKKVKYDGQGHITGTADVTANDLPQHAHSTNLIIDTISQNYENLGITTMGATQEEINTAINTIIGNLSSFKAIEIVSTRPTASASTMNKLYIVSENSKVNVYYTKKSGSTYSWQKMDADILDELSINWSDIQGKPSFGTGASDFAVGNHSHGSITNDGKLGTANRFVVTDGSKNITVKEKLGNITLDGKLANASQIVITDANKNITSVPAVTGAYIIEGQDYNNIGATSGTSLSTILHLIDSALGNKANNNHAHSNYIAKGGAVTSIELVPKSSDATGAIRLYYGDEPSNNS